MIVQYSGVRCVGCAPRVYVSMYDPVRKRYISGYDIDMGAVQIRGTYELCVWY